MRALCRWVLGLIVAVGGATSLAAPEFAPVTPGRVLVFPQDHGAHPAFRTEWWYVTGWLEDEQGVERGFQITFFRRRTGIGEDNPSRFAPRQILIAHAALADPQQGRLMHAERSARQLEPLVGAAEGETRVWIDDWRLQRDDAGYRASIAADAFTLDLQLQATGAPVLNGQGGFSRKAADPRHASYYYSQPQLRVSGRLRTGGLVRAVKGLAWLDHEWSSELMPPGARGWDWLGINLHGGGALMAFRMRGTDGQTAWSAGTLRDPGGTARALDAKALAFHPGRRWRSSRTGTEYPVEWTLEIAGRTLRVRPLMDDQELDARRSTGAIYWEGAVRVFEGDREIGRGYLEMTGYANPLRM